VVRLFVYGPVGWLTFSLTFPPFNFLKGPLTPLLTPTPLSLPPCSGGFFLIISKMISKGKEMDEWMGETKELMSTCLLRNKEGEP